MRIFKRRYVKVPRDLFNRLREVAGSAADGPHVSFSDYGISELRKAVADVIRASEDDRRMGERTWR